MYELSYDSDAIARLFYQKHDSNELSEIFDTGIDIGELMIYHLTYG